MNEVTDKHMQIFSKFIETNGTIYNVSKFKTNDRVNLFTIYSRFKDAIEISINNANSVEQIMSIFAEAVFQLNAHIIRRISKYSATVEADDKIKFLDIFKSVQHEDFTSYVTTFDYLKNTGVLLIYLASLTEDDNNRNFYNAIVYITIEALNYLQKFNNFEPYYKGVVISFERTIERNDRKGEFEY